MTSAYYAFDRRREPAWMRNIDWVAVACAVATAAFGLLMIYSSTRNRLLSKGISGYHDVQRQAQFLTIGLIAMAISMAIDYRRLLDWAVFLYFGTCGLLAAVLVVGKSHSGTQAWFAVGPLEFQPSEFSKVSLIVCAAAYVAGRHGSFTLRKVLTLLGLACVPLGLVFLQGDLGTSLVFGVITLAVLLVSGARARHILSIIAVAILGVILMLQLGVLKDYQVNRLTAFVSQSDSVQASNTSLNDPSYNLIQAKKAIGSGGMSGSGLFKGQLTNLSYVPVQKSDFIFTAVGEQLGFAGAAGLLSVIAFLVWRIWRIGMSARDHAGMLICVGVLAMIVFQTFENVGMTMGIMPITGIPLPFVSYGGTALVACFAAVGLTFNVGLRR